MTTNSTTASLPFPSRRERRAQAKLERKQARRSARAQAPTQVEGSLEQRIKGVIERAKAAPSRLGAAAHGSLSGPQRICLSSIMKESNPAVVSRCLTSARPYISAWRIADSGCSEAVKATIHHVLRGIPGELIPITWTGFADARNTALDAARESGCDYALFIDADDFIAPLLRSDGRRAFQVALPQLRAEFYEPLNELDGEKWQWLRLALARLTTSARWRGKVHEQLVPDGVHADGLVEFRVVCTRDGAASQAGLPAKMRRYRDLLREEVTQEHASATTWRLLGEHEAAAGDYHAALAAFTRALTLGPDPDERYALLVQRAEILGALGAATHEVVSAFESLIEEHPDRAEAPRWLARHLEIRGELLESARELHAYADTLPCVPCSGWMHFDSYRRRG